MFNAEETLNSELPQARYLVLELAALLDRIDEAAQRDGRSLAGDARLRPLRDAIAALHAPAARPDRAERILRIYSETAAPAGR